MSDFLCKLTDHVNTLTATIKNMQSNTGLYTDPSSESTVTGRVKRLEEQVINSDPSETNISRMQVDNNRPITGNTFGLTKEPIGNIINNEIQAQHPSDNRIWDPLGVVSISGKTVTLESDELDGWVATASYLYAEKIVYENYSYTNVIDELVKDLYEYMGPVYLIVLTVVPDGTVTLTWEDNDTGDSIDDVIETTHTRYIYEDDFNHTLYLTGTAEVELEIRNRIS